MSTRKQIYEKAQRHLARRDPVLKRLIKQVGPCTLQHNENLFEVLVRSIISQQISTKAARSIGARLEQSLQPRGICSEAILAAKEQTMRQAGLSAGKTRSMKDLAQKVHDEQVALHTLHELTDDEVVKHLIPVHGIGPWTAEMLLIFGLGRLDVLPLADLGLRVGVQRQYELKERPGKDHLMAMAESWRPYRSVATWFFWRSFGNVPQSEPK